MKTSFLDKNDVYYIENRKGRWMALVSSSNNITKYAEVPNASNLEEAIELSIRIMLNKEYNDIKVVYTNYWSIK